MGTITASLFLTLDGVYQSPGGREEDTEGGFAFGGWQAPVSDEAEGELIVADILTVDALLLGRRTYDTFAAYWPDADPANPIAEHFNRIPKFVVSTTLSEPAWAGTEVLRDAMAAAHLRERFENVQLIGSGDLLQSLLREDVVDRLNLWLYPLTLGEGKRVFQDGTIPATFRLTQPARSFDKGAVRLVYERAGDVETRDIDEEN